MRKEERNSPRNVTEWSLREEEKEPESGGKAGK
jgi:hypothetical protein